jgi:hypothetical protein
MNQISPATTSCLLEVSMEDLHQESKTWLSEIEFWRIELSFYQQLLEKVARHTLGEDKKAIDHFQSLIFYFKGELLDQYEHDIREHERYLDAMVEEKAPFDEAFYREKHKKYESQINSFGIDFKQYRKELYAFAGKHL